MRRFALLTIGILLFTTALPAAVTTGTIQVIVTESSGAPLPGVTVSAQAGDVTTRRTAVTNEQGVATLVSMDPSAQYTVSAALAGLGTSQTRNVRVQSAQTTTVRTQLRMAAAEAITVTAEAPIVDTRSATTGQDVTLQLTESLPTGRTYQSYLQLVPGVLPDNNNVTTGNPASRSGVNYSDIGGDLGLSTDNFYYIEGINVTDPLTGTFGANLNTEVIQEQKVMTGGVPAEFAGAPGLLSSVVTKSGSNTLSGSVNYYLQNDDLVAQNKHQGDSTFSTYDAAFTLGGPVLRDRLWFFTSYRFINREDDVTALDSNELIRSVENEGRQAFGKVTFQLTDRDRFSATYTDDPADISGESDRTFTNARDRSRETGGGRFVVDYGHVFGSNFLVDLAAGKHNGEVSVFSAINEIRNDVVFQQTDARTLFDEQLGGDGNINISERDTEFAKASGEALFATGWASHTVKAGLEFEEHRNFRNSNFIGGAQYVSLSNRYAGQGITAGDISTGSWSQLEFNVFNTSDFPGLILNINKSPNKAKFYNLLDTNKDGTITPEEAALAMLFNSTAGNPNGMVNYQRDFQSADGPQETNTEGTVFYIQDTVQVGKFAVNLGVRAEEWAHFATTGQEIYTFDWTYAPRISGIYDIKGDGRQKASAFYGRYYDPIRLNMTNFAGTLTGRILEEQVWVGDEWVTYRTRGGPVVQDAFFAPTTKTPYTDEYQVSYQIDLGRNMTFETNVVRRQTRDILEDYDLALYALDTEGGTVYPGPVDHPDSLWLGLEYFGYTQNPGSNFVIATLAGGKRDYEGIDLIFRKRYANNWQLLTSYTYSDYKSNTNSDSNADFQGDVLFLDPRAPNQYGTAPGSIDHLFKVAGSYRFFDRLELGAIYNWNSGTHASSTFRASRRNLPAQIPAGSEYDFAGITSERWITEGAVGGLTNPSYGVLDLRAQWNQPLGRTALEIFVDVFNATDSQSTIRQQDLVAGLGSFAFGESFQWVSPRRFYLGARVVF